MPRTAEGEDAMGEAGKDALRVDFDGSVKLEVHGSKLTSDGGLIPYRELDGVLGLTEMAGALLRDWRTGQIGEALVADDAAGEACQDRSEGRVACTLRDLPGGGGCCAKEAVPGDLGADPTAANARDGAAMTPTKDETAGGRGGNGDGLLGSTVDARVEGVLGSITARQGPDASARDPNKRLSIAGIVIESSKIPTMVVGRRASGKSRPRMILTGQT